MDLGPILIEPPFITPAVDVVGRGYWPRAFAYILDFIVVNLTSFAVGFVGGAAFWFFLSITASVFSYKAVYAEPATLYNYAIGFLVSLTYFISFEALSGATPGKLILRMRVATITGDRPSLKAAAIRALWRLIDGLFFGLVAAASMTVPLQQRHGDKRAMTIVVASNSLILRYKLSALRFILAALIYLLSSFIIQSLSTLPLITFQAVR
jgi:uncharacterized RDD family membrane protein YckC